MTGDLIPLKVRARAQGTHIFLSLEAQDIFLPPTALSVAEARKLRKHLKKAMKAITAHQEAEDRDSGPL